MSSSKMSTRVYVGGLNHRSREKDIERFFRKFGRIREISLKKNGFCFVEFDDYRDADDACYEMNGRDLLGDRVTVEIARGTPHGRDREKWGTGGGGGGGGRDLGRDSRRMTAEAEEGTAEVAIAPYGWINMDHQLARIT